MQIVAYDFGCKNNILRRLASFGCKVTVVPAEYPAQKVMELAPDGIFLSNGPVNLLPKTRAKNHYVGCQKGPAAACTKKHPKIAVLTDEPQQQSVDVT